MSTDLRDKIAAALYLFTEYSGTGDPLWSGLLAAYGDDNETVVAYRNMADFVMPVVDAAMADKVLHSVNEHRATQSRFAKRFVELEDEVDRLGAAVKSARVMAHELEHEWVAPSVEQGKLLEPIGQELSRRLSTASIAATEPGCSCNGMAACEQCQERDAHERRRAQCLKPIQEPIVQCDDLSEHLPHTHEDGRKVCVGVRLS